MKKDYIDFYLAFSDLKKLKPDQWYPVPTNPLKREFVYWYHKETMAIDFSANRTHFMVRYYPTEAEKNRVLSSVGYDPAMKKSKKDTIPTYDPSALMDKNKVMPGMHDIGKCEIVSRIMSAELKAKEEKDLKYKRQAEFRKKKKEFMSGQDDTIDGL